MIGELMTITGTIVCLAQEPAERVLAAHQVSGAAALEAIRKEDDCLLVLPFQGAVEVIPTAVLGVAEDVTFPNGNVDTVVLAEGQSGEATIWFFGPESLLEGGQEV